MTRLESADIQGLVLRGYRAPAGRHHFLRIDDATAFKAALRALLPSVTSGAHWGDGKPARCVNVGFTWTGLARLGLPMGSLASFPAAFQAGAAARAGWIPEPSDGWEEPFAGDELHAIVSVFAWQPRRLDATLAGATELRTLDVHRLVGGTEHFGFVDGLSQPTLKGFPTGLPDPLDPVPPGQVVVGMDADNPEIVEPVPEPVEFARNGSFAAFRVMQQDVPAFASFLAEQSGRLGVDEELVAAKLCGRWRSGEPLMLRPDEHAAPVPRERWNAFDYETTTTFSEGDPEGRVCPRGAHIRRAFPRSQRVVDDGQGLHRRIVRRAMPYGPPYDPDEDGSEERGLAGFFICASLEHQFEYVMRHWINDGLFTGGRLGRDRDPLIAAHQHGRLRAPDIRLEGIPRFVETRGAAYVFLPEPDGPARSVPGSMGRPERAPVTTEIELCGSIAARIAGREVTKLPGRQGRMLFAYLVLHRDRPVGRDELIDVIWPKDTPAAPRAAFASILARVRQAVGAGVIEGNGELTLRLEREACVDVEVARELLGEARQRVDTHPQASWDAARASQRIVARPLLPGLSGAWVDAARNELTDLDSQLLELMAEAALKIDPAEGAAVARTLVERHPYRETGYALLMRIQAERGDVAEAVRTFHRLRALLQEQLGTSPSARIVEFHDRLLRRGSADGLAPPPSAVVPLPVIGAAAASQPFVGRAAPLAQLHEVWRNNRTGPRTLVMVSGDAGAGKTRMAAEFAAAAHADSATVLYGRCEEDPIRSYQPFVQALRHYLAHGDWQSHSSTREHLRELSPLIPEARTTDATASAGAQVERHRLFEAVTTLLTHVAATRPLVLVLDDLQWADKPTLLLLRHLLHAGASEPLLVIGTLRHTEITDEHPILGLIADLRRERRVERIELGGLDAQETRALLRASFSVGPSPRFVRELHRRTGGNPFFIEEVLRALADAADASASALESIDVPAGVDDVILRRLSRLSRSTRDILTIAAVAGIEFDLGGIRAVLEMPADQVVVALEEAMERGLIVELPGRVDRFAFCHALVRDAIYHRLSTSRRLRLHLRLALALEAGAGLEPPSPAELAHHYFLARELGATEAAVRCSLDAGRDAAAACAYEDAIMHYRRAIEGLSGDDQEQRRCELLLALGRAQWQAGEADARETYLHVAESARDRGDGEQLARAALGLADRYWEAGLVAPEHQRLIAEALDALAPGDSTVRVRLMARVGQHLHFADGGRGARLSDDALAMARRLDDRDTLVKALLARHVALLHTQHLAERRELIAEALVLSREHHALSAEAKHWHIFDLCESGELERARHDSVELERLAQRLGQPLLHYVAAGWRGMFAHLAGDVEASERLADYAYELGRRVDAGEAASSHTAKLLTPRRQQGRIGELLPRIEQIAERTQMPSWETALSLAEIESGNRKAGRSRYRRLIADRAEALPRDWYWLPALAQLAEASWALQDAEGAAFLYEQLTPYADRMVQLSILVCWGSLQRHLGMLATVIGDASAAEVHLNAALRANADARAPLMLAETQCVYAALCVRRGGPGDLALAAELAERAEVFATDRRLLGLADRASRLRTGALVT